MILGTAGHIDHGKTALVKALTGVDADRLPEEKRRGITIDLGYAFVDVPGDPASTGAAARLGFIDVPGHERLVHTMLAGATGIDHALLLVACDDGVMPQTREHLAVLALLQVPSATLVLTKCDRATPERIDAVTREVRALVARTPFADAPLHVVSALGGQGIDGLKAHVLALVKQDRDVRGRDEAGDEDTSTGFRLAVDRVFTLEGIGTVATGTVLAGRVQVGDALAVVPGGASRPARVRSVHAQGAPAAQARRGQRAALALGGFAREDLRRGQVLCTPAIVPAAAAEARRIDATWRPWDSAEDPLRDGLVVHLHLGADDVMARVDVLARVATDGPARTFVQLVTRTPVAAWHGDRFVVRDASASRTLAGGVVLDPGAPVRHRRSAERLTLLSALAQRETASRWRAALDASPRGLDVADRARAEGRLAPPAWPEGARRVGDLAFSPAAWEALRARAGEALDRFHAQCPEERGPTSERLRRLAGVPLAEAAWREILEDLVRAGTVTRQGPWYQRPAHAGTLGVAERRLAERLLPRVLAGEADPPWVRDLARDTGTPEEAVRTTLAHVAREGTVFPVVRDLYYHAQVLDRLARVAADLAGRDGDVRAAAFRDASGLGRKRAIQVLEFFDRTGLLRRVGEAHRLRGDPAMFGMPPAGATGGKPTLEA
jgi:selenocysteine-specific elongation factor